MNASTLVTFNQTLEEQCQGLLGTLGQGHVTEPPAARVAVGFTLVSITIVTFASNVIVLLALTLGPGRPSSFSLSLTLTVSLVTADLLLSIAVMPFATYNIVGDSWALGKLPCRLYLTIDIFLCTTSIFHLVGLALDRYLAVCRTFLYQRLNPCWAHALSSALWTLAFLVAFPALIPEWHTQGTEDVLAAKCVLHLYETGRTCVFLLAPLYQSVVIPLAFFVPLLLLIGFHVPIYIASRTQVRQLRKLQPRLGFVSREGRGEASSGQARKANYRSSIASISKEKNTGPADDAIFSSPHGQVRFLQPVGVTCISYASGEERYLSDSHKQTDCRVHETRDTTEAIARDGQIIEQRSSPQEKEKKSAGKDSSCKTKEQNSGIKRRAEDEQIRTKHAHKRTQVNRNQHGSESSEASRHRRQENNKAIKTVLCLVLCFVICWLPLFTVLLVQSNDGSAVPLSVVIVFTWLGYVSSTLNPLLYYCFNRTIRRAIRLLFKLEDSRNN